jgi:hypothetical protein
MSTSAQPYHQQDITQAVFNILQNAAEDLGIGSNADNVPDVFYGDQKLIPRTPAICVEPGPMRRNLKGATGPYPTMDNQFNLVIMCYLYSLAGNIQALEINKDLFLDQVQDVLHADYKLSGSPGTTEPGLVIWSHCESIDPGYTIRSGVLMRCGRISWTAMNRSFLLDS